MGVSKVSGEDSLCEINLAASCSTYQMKTMARPAFCAPDVMASP